MTLISGIFRGTTLVVGVDRIVVVSGSHGQCVQKNCGKSLIGTACRVSVSLASDGWCVRLALWQHLIGRSVCEWVGWKYRVVEDNGLGLAAEEADL